MRERFAIAPGLVYLDACSIGPLPRATAQAVCQAVDGHSTIGIRSVPGLPLHSAEVETARQLAARLIGAEPGEIAFVRNTVEGLNTIAHGIDWRPGDNIVGNALEFPANVYAWMNLAARGVDLRLARPSDGRVTAEVLAPLIDSRTRAVTISFVQYLNGFRADLRTIGELCRSRGCLFIVDAIQGLGALALDVRDVGIDFLAAGGHKWLLSPVGSGILFCNRRHVGAMHVMNAGHLSVERASEFSNFNLTWRADARRFEGGVVSHPLICGLRRSLELFLELGIARIEVAILSLTDELVAGLERLGYGVASPRGPREKSGIVSISLGSEESARALRTRLAELDIVVSHHGPILRFAVGFYNTRAEIAGVLSALKRA